MKRTAFFLGLYFLTFLAVEKTDKLAQAFFLIKDENRVQADVEYAEESFKLLRDEKYTESLSEALKKRCEKMKLLQQRMIDALNNSDVLPLNPLTFTPYPVLYRVSECHSDRRLLPRERYVLDIIVGTTIFLQEAACPENKYKTYVDRDYELGEELVMQNLATDIKKEFSLPHENKVYFIEAARQKGTECVYRALENTVYALYALTQEKREDAVALFKEYISQKRVEENIGFFIDTDDLWHSFSIIMHATTKGTESFIIESYMSLSDIHKTIFSMTYNLFNVSTKNVLETLVLAESNNKSGVDQINYFYSKYKD